MTINAATTTFALVRFCSTLALLACSPTVLEVPADHPADPATVASLPDIRLARLDAGALHSRADLGVNATGHAHHGHGKDEAVASSNETNSDGTPRWTCPMHPEVLRDGPGSCPICGMHLVEKKDSPPPGAKP
jgi:hypothetical protein